MADTTYATLAWESSAHQSHSTSPIEVTHRVPVPVSTEAARLARIPGLRNARIEAAPVQLGDVPAPWIGWTEAERDDIPFFPYGYAAQAVKCPKCSEPGGMSCRSTGGGNRAYVPTHKARLDRIAGWTNATQGHAEILVKAVGHYGYGEADLFTAFEQAASPVPVKATKPVTPKGVRLSEKQAEQIEYIVHGGGTAYCPTTHFHGDHQYRQTLLALESKDILEEAGVDSDGERLLRLTAFGWQVYRQHRLIIRRCTAAEVDALEAAAMAPSA